jgi:hypothetical protein
MRYYRKLKPIVILVIILHNSLIINAQDTLKGYDQQIKIFVVTKNDGTEYTGTILKQDEREILLDTKEIGRLYIPKHEIRSIRELAPDDFKIGTLPGNNIFSSRYFLTTNGLSMRKGDSYALFNYWGPEIQVSVADRFTIGAMTTWIALPIVLSAKTSVSANDNLHFGFGLLAGTLSWASLGTVGALPYATITLGNYRNNFNLSAGYAMISINTGGDNSIFHTTRTHETGSAPLLSMACQFRISDKVSFVGDSFIYLKDNGFAIIVPGIRVSKKPDRAFQIGFSAISADGELVPMPIPMVSWYIRL